MIELVVCPILVGREEELSTVEDSLLAATRGEGGLVLLSGEAGLGKTRMASELRQRAGRIGCTVLLGGCAETDMSLPYLPFLEAVGNYLRTADLTTLRERLGRAARELGSLFPQLSPEAPAELIDPAQARLRFFEAVVSLLDAISADGALLLVIEDLQWAEASTRELLDYMARRIRALPILILGTYRSDEMHRRHPLLPTIQGWHRSGLARTVELDHLDSEHVGQMVCAIFHEKDMTDDFRDYLHQRSEGNPFVLEEMLKEAVERGDLFLTDAGWDRKAVDDLRLPRLVADNILLRVERLDADTVTVLRAAAVLGQSFGYAALVALTGFAPVTVQEAMAACIRHQLIEEEQRGTGWYRFRHALTREAIYDDTVHPRRDELHSRAADVLREDPSAGHVEVARHLMLARRYTDAVPLLLEAAHGAMDRFAFADAAALYEKALPHLLGDNERAETLCQLGVAHSWSAKLTAAVAELDEGIALLQRLGRTAECGRYRRELSLVHYFMGSWDAEREQLDLAVRDLEPLGPSEDLARTYARLSLCTSNDLRAAEASDIAQKALSIATEAGSETARLDALDALAQAGGFWGRPLEADALFRRAYLDASAAGIITRTERTARNWVTLWGNDRRPVQMRRLMEEVEEHSIQAPDTIVQWTLFASWLALQTGRVDSAFSLTSEALDQATVIESWRPLAETFNALALLEMDRLEEARRHALDAPGLEQMLRADLIDEWDFKMRLSLAEADLEQAVLIAEEIFDARGWSIPAWLCDAVVEVFVAADRTDDALRMIAHPDALIRTADNGRYLERAAGRIALACGDPEAARERLRAAAESMRSVGAVIEELRTLVPLARAQAACDDKLAATATLEHVVAVAREGGAGLHARLALKAASELELDLNVIERPPAATAPLAATAETVTPGVPDHATEPITILCASVRDAASQDKSTADMAHRITAFQRWAKHEVVQHGGRLEEGRRVAITAYFEPSSADPDRGHPAILTALALRDKAALAELPLGIGIAFGMPDLALRLHEAAGAGQVLLSAGAYEHARPWLEQRGLAADPQRIQLADVDAPVMAHSLRPRIGVPRDTRTASIGSAEEGGGPATPNFFRREGEYWTLGYGGQVVRLKDSKGLEDITRLLATPGTEVAAIDLASGPTAETRSANPRMVADAGLSMEGDAGSALDAEARHQYRTRLRELEEEINESDANNDPERASRAREEREFLLAELGAAVGLGGRGRRVLDPAERARKAVTGRIRDAISHIEAAHPQLGRHLRRSIRTGSFCTYDPPEPTQWSL